MLQHKEEEGRRKGRKKFLTRLQGLPHARARAARNSRYFTRVSKVAKQTPTLPLFRAFDPLPSFLGFIQAERLETI